MKFNLAYEAEDISDESSPVAEPVTLAEMKDYLRLEGFGGDSSSGIAMQEPLQLVLNGLSVQDALLQQDGAKVTNVQREGLGYAVVTGTPVGRQCVIDYAAGTVTFPDADVDADINIQYGIQGEASTVDDFDFDDTLILEMITSARQWCEVRTGCSLVPKTIQVVITNWLGGQDLPAGPVTGPVTGVDCEGDSIVIVTKGSKFPSLTSPCLANMVLAYPAGYTQATIPAGLKQAIKSHVADQYENRGDVQTALPTFKRAAALCSPFIKGSAYA